VSRNFLNISENFYLFAEAIVRDVPRRIDVEQDALVIALQQKDFGSVNGQQRPSAPIAVEGEQLRQKVSAEAHGVAPPSPESRRHDSIPSEAESLGDPGDGRRPQKRHVSEGDDPAFGVGGSRDAEGQAGAHAANGVGERERLESLEGQEAREALVFRTDDGHGAIDSGSQRPGRADADTRAA